MELKTITLDQLKAANPDLVNSIKAEERARIKAFDIWANKTTGAEEIIKKYKYDDPKNASEVMEELLNYIGKTPETTTNSKAEEKELLQIFENKKKETEESGVEGITGINSEELKAAKLEKDITSIINLANNL